jgi:hypothetical protein
VQHALDGKSGTAAKLVRSRSFDLPPATAAFEATDPQLLVQQAIQLVRAPCAMLHRHAAFACLKVPLPDCACQSMHVLLSRCTAQLCSIAVLKVVAAAQP